MNQKIYKIKRRLSSKKFRHEVLGIVALVIIGIGYYFYEKGRRWFYSVFFLPIEIYRLATNSQYRKEQLTLDKKSLLLMIIGIPVGVGIVFGVFYLFMLIFGIDSVRNAILATPLCPLYHVLFGLDICSN